MSTPRRTDAYHHGDLRQALVEAALRALDHQRPEDLSLRALGRELGVSPRAPYRHFPTKEALLAAVAVEGFRDFQAFLETNVAQAGADPIARLGAVAESYVTFAVERPAAFQLMYAPYATVDEGADALLAARAASHGTSSQLIAEAQERGLLRAGDATRIGLVLWTSMHGLAVLLAQGQLARFDRPVNASKLAKLVFADIVQGLRP